MPRPGTTWSPDSASRQQQPGCRPSVLRRLVGAHAASVGTAGCRRAGCLTGWRGPDPAPCRASVPALGRPAVARRAGLSLASAAPGWKRRLADSVAGASAVRTWFEPFRWRLPGFAAACCQRLGRRWCLYSNERVPRSSSEWAGPWLLEVVGSIWRLGVPVSVWRWARARPRLVDDVITHRRGC